MHPGYGSFHEVKLSQNEHESDLFLHFVNVLGQKKTWHFETNNRATRRNCGCHIDNNYHHTIWQQQFLLVARLFVSKCHGWQWLSFCSVNRLINVIDLWKEQNEYHCHNRLLNEDAKELIGWPLDSRLRCCSRGLPEFIFILKTGILSFGRPNTRQYFTKFSL